MNKRKTQPMTLEQLGRLVITGRPDFDLLRFAYAVIGGIPDEKVRLHNIVSHRGPSLACGTVACAAGWLAMHPEFQARGLTLIVGTGPHSTRLAYRGTDTRFQSSYNLALAPLFNISQGAASVLFAARDCKRTRVRTDKQLFLLRLYEFLYGRGQTMAQLQADNLDDKRFALSA